MSIDVLIVDDQPPVRASLRSILEHTDDITVVGEAANGAEAIAQVERRAPDVVLMDIRMPVMDGIRATRAIVRDAVADPVRVIVLTTFGLDEYVFAALREGASGFLTKNVAPAELRRAIRLVADGHALLDPAVTRRVIEHFTSPAPVPRSTALDVLTPRERELARLIAAGLSNEEISQALTVSIWTVKTHVSHILAKLGARERAQIVIAMYQAGDVAHTPETGR